MPQLTPAFSAAAYGLAYLLSLPVMCLVFAKEIARGGMDYVLVMMGGVFVFPILMVSGYQLFRFILRSLPGVPLRCGFVLLCGVAILAWHGMPGIFAIVFGIFMIHFLYRTEVKVRNDARALEQFDAHGG